MSVPLRDSSLSSFFPYRRVPGTTYDAKLATQKSAGTKKCLRVVLQLYTPGIELQVL